MTIRHIILYLVILTGHIISYGQVNIGIGFPSYDFQKEKGVHTVFAHLNSDERIKDKKGWLMFYNKNNNYMLPRAEINSADEMTSSENNYLLQLKSGRAYFGEKRILKDDFKIIQYNKAIEINPTCNSDKFLKEILTYGQFKFLTNLIVQKNNTDNQNIKWEHSLAFGPFTNLGFRYSKNYNDNQLYSTVGILLDHKTALFNNQNKEQWIIKIVGNYYHINSDLNQITSDKFGGLIKTSIDRLMFVNNGRSAYLGVSYKYGNDNPNYKYIHVLMLSSKLSFL